MERFKFSSEHTKFAKRFVKKQTHSGLELDTPHVHQNSKLAKPIALGKDESEEAIFEHYLDENGRWISN